MLAVEYRWSRCRHRQRDVTHDTLVPCVQTTAENLVGHDPNDTAKAGKMRCCHPLRLTGFNLPECKGLGGPRPVERGEDVTGARYVTGAWSRAPCTSMEVTVR